MAVLFIDMMSLFRYKDMIKKRVFSNWIYKTSSYIILDGLDINKFS